MDRDTTYSPERVAATIRDSISVINTECMKVASLVKSFEEANDPAVKDISDPLVQTLKGFMSHIRSVILSSQNKLFHLTKSGDPVDVARQSSQERADEGPQNKLIREYAHTMRESMHNQQDVELQLTMISREMVEDCLASNYADHRDDLVELQKRYRKLAKTIGSSEVYISEHAKGKKALDYYKAVFQQDLPNALYCLIRLTFMFEAHDPKKLKQKLIGLPKNNMDDSIRKDILAELDRDSKFLDSPIFTQASTISSIPALAQDLSTLADDYRSASRMVSDLCYMYAALQRAGGKAEREDMLSSFSSTWNTAGKLSRYSNDVDTHVVGWLWQTVNTDHCGGK